MHNWFSVRFPFMVCLSCTWKTCMTSIFCQTCWRLIYSHSTSSLLYVCSCLDDSVSFCQLLMIILIVVVVIIIILIIYYYHYRELTGPLPLVCVNWPQWCWTSSRKPIIHHDTILCFLNLSFSETDLILALRKSSVESVNWWLMTYKNSSTKFLGVDSFETHHLSLYVCSLWFLLFFSRSF